MTGRVGFCCKYLDPDQTQKKKILMEIQQQRTERSTTVAWLDRQTVDVAEGVCVVQVRGHPSHGRRHVPRRDRDRLPGR